MYTFSTLKKGIKNKCKLINLSKLYFAVFKIGTVLTFLLTVLICLMVIITHKPIRKCRNME